MGERHGCIAGARGEKRRARVELPGAFAGHRHEGDAGHEFPRGLGQQEQPADKQSEQGAIEAGEAAIGLELRLPPDDRRRDGSAGEGEGQRAACP